MPDFNSLFGLVLERVQKPLTTKERNRRAEIAQQHVAGASRMVPPPQATEVLPEPGAPEPHPPSKVAVLHQPPKLFIRRPRPTPRDGDR